MCRSPNKWDTIMGHESTCGLRVHQQNDCIEEEGSDSLILLWANQVAIQVWH